jgi:hypothetical protein
MDRVESEEEFIEKKRIAAERNRLMKVWQEHVRVRDEKKEYVVAKGDEDGGGDDGGNGRDDDLDTRFFWYYDEGECWVDPDIVNIPSIDKANTILWRGDTWISTEIFSTIPGYTIEEYHQEFCKLDVVSGKWIYKG